HGRLNQSNGWRNNQHFGTLDAAKSRINFIQQVTTKFQTRGFIYPALLDIRELKRVEDADYSWDSVIELAKKECKDGLVYENNNEGSNADSYLVFEPEQIHILGSQRD